MSERIKELIINDYYKIANTKMTETHDLFNIQLLTFTIGNMTRQLNIGIGEQILKLLRDETKDLTKILDRTPEFKGKNVFERERKEADYFTTIVGEYKNILVEEMGKLLANNNILR